MFQWQQANGLLCVNNHCFNDDSSIPGTVFKARRNAGWQQASAISVLFNWYYWRLTTWVFQPANDKNLSATRRPHNNGRKVVYMAHCFDKVPEPLSLPMQWSLCRSNLPLARTERNQIEAISVRLWTFDGFRCLSPKSIGVILQAAIGINSWWYLKYYAYHRHLPNRHYIAALFHQRPS